MAAVFSSRRAERRVFFPWEERGGVIGAIGRRRARFLLLAGAIAAAVTAIYANGERAAATRATRASLTTTGRAVSAYRADHAGACPRVLGDLVAQAYMHTEPVDAWGRALRLECPGRRDPRGFDLSSDGPDGLPGGLDQVQ